MQDLFNLRHSDDIGFDPCPSTLPFEQLNFFVLLSKQASRQVLTGKLLAQYSTSSGAAWCVNRGIIMNTKQKYRYYK